MVGYGVGQWQGQVLGVGHIAGVVFDRWVAEMEERSDVVGEADLREVLGGKSLGAVVRMFH